jgi:hypothetical protein
MVRLIVLLLGVIRAAISSRSNLVLENLALRQQVAALARSRLGSPSLVLDGAASLLVQMDGRRPASAGQFE